MNWKETVERYLEEGRTVSGGDINPPGKPGFVSINFYAQGNAQLLSEFIAFAQSKGFTKVEEQTNDSALLSNYEG